MSVVGIDLGSAFSKVAVAHRANISMVPNEMSKLQTSTMCGFTDKERTMGESAVTGYRRNYANTIPQITRFIGRQFTDSTLAQDLSQWVKCPAVEMPNGTVGFEVMTGEGKQRLHCEQILAGFLRQLKSFTSKFLDNRTVKDCVIACPNFFTDAQRRALLCAARLAELNVLTLMNETTAVALNYGILRDLPKDSTRRVVFVDVGFSNTQVSVVDFIRGKLTVCVAQGNPHVGARDFDAAMFEKFRHDFESANRTSMQDRPRATIRLMNECSKVKKMLSANRDAVVPIESLMDDMDITLRMERSELESRSKDVLSSIEETVSNALQAMKAYNEQHKASPTVHSVEIVGGGSRIPCVQECIMRALKSQGIDGIDKLNTTLNGDESVARGATLMCAMLSPNFKVRDFQVQDMNVWPIAIEYPSEESKKEIQEEVIKSGHPCPCTAKVTFHKQQSFDLTLLHPEKDVNYYPMKTRRQIGKFRVQVPSLSEELLQEPKIKMLVNLTRHGVVDVPKGTLVEFVKYHEPEAKAKPEAEARTETGKEGSSAKDESEKEKGEPMDVDTESQDAAKTDSSETSDEARTEDKGKDQERGPEKGPEPGKEGKKESSPKKKKKKEKRKVTRCLTVSGRFENQTPEEDFKDWMELESKLANIDRIVTETHEKRNELETYVYDMRDKLESTHREFMKDEEREFFMRKLEAIEDWLYDKGEEANKTVLEGKLREIAHEGTPVLSRAWEYEHRTHRMEQLKKVIVKYQHFSETTEEKYSHISAEEKGQVLAAANECDEWLSNREIQQSRLAKHDIPAVMCSQIDQKYRDLIKVCQPILTKPKPKPKPEPESQPEPEAEAAKETEKDEVKPESDPKSEPKNEPKGEQSANEEKNDATAEQSSELRPEATDADGDTQMTDKQ